MNNIKTVDIIWQAGFVDGEGAIGISRQIQTNRKNPIYRPYAIVVNCNPNLPTNFKEHWGGIVYEKPDKRANCRTSYAWHCPIKSMPAFLKSILPYTKAKTELISLLVKLLEHKSKSAKRLSQDDIQFREDLWHKAKELNVKGKR